jgi:hypothetical protein
MNIKLVFKDSNFKIDVMEDTPCQYLYGVAQKIFRKKSSDIVLFYGKTEIENDSRLLFDVMGKDDKEDVLDEEIIIVRLKKDLMNEYSMKYKMKPLKTKGNDNLNNSDKQLPHILKTSGSLDTNRIKRKKLPIKCQICSHKNSIFYCRQCNMFICFECNIRYVEHHKHKRINLEDGDTKLGVATYKEKILGELKLIDLGYQKFSKWILSNVDRDNMLQTTFKLLEKIKKSSQKLSDIKTLYNLDQDQVKNLKSEIEKTKVPLIQEELVEIFSNLNAKDKEIENYIKCVDLQIIKTEYNKVLLNCISDVQKSLNKIIDDVESKLHECEDMKYWGINEVKLYLKNNKDDKEEREDIELFNNLENLEKNKKNYNSTKNNFKDSSEYLDDSEEDIKKYKNTIRNNDIYENKASAVTTERKKDDSFINTRTKKKKKVNIVTNEDLDDEKNIINKKEDKYFNMKRSAINFPSIMYNKMPTQEDINYKNGKDKDVIKNIISNFDDENVETEFYSPNKRISSIQYPLINNNLRSVSVNMNKINDDVSDTKYVQNDFKNFKQEKRYGKKLVNIMRRRNDNKKD